MIQNLGDYAKKGTVSAFKGKKHTEEARKKMSLRKNYFLFATCFLQANLCGESERDLNG